MTLFDIFNILLGFICVQNVFLDIFIFRFPLYSCSSQNSLCLAPPIHLLYQEQFTPSALPRWLKQTNTRMAWGVWSLFPTVFSKYSLQIVWKEHGHQCIDNEVGIKASGNSLIGRFIALHSLHIVRHDNIHITIRIMNWLTQAASPKTWRFVFSDAAAAVCVCVSVCVCACVRVCLKTHFSLAWCCISGPPKR